MHVLVTGGAGFIGSHLTETLLAEGHSVRVLDNFSSGKRSNLAHMLPDIELIEGDIRDLDTCRQACAGIDRVWHLAALGSVPISIDQPLLANEINITGTLHVLLAARDAGVQRLVFASSSAVYGANPTLPREETQALLPMSPYANTKMAGEFYVRMFPSLYGMEAVALRFFNVYGPRQDPNSMYAAAVPSFFSALLSGQRPIVYGDGEQSREFIYVADCVRANILAGTVEKEGISGEAFNVATGQPITINDLLSTIQRVLGKDVPANYQPTRPGDVRYSDARIDNIVNALNFQPLWSLENGIRKTAEWYVAWHAEQSRL